MRLGNLTLDQVAEICTARCSVCPLNETGICEDLPDNWDLDMEVDVEE